MREVKKDKKRDFIGEKKKEALAAKKAKEADRMEADARAYEEYAAKSRAKAEKLRQELAKQKR